MKSTVTFLLTLILSLFSSAKSPETPIRTFDDLGEEKCTKSTVDTSNMPDNRNQKDLEWCHAYAFADLMSFYAKKKISAFGVALESFRFRNLNEKESFRKYNLNPVQHFVSFLDSNRKLCTEKNFQLTTEEDWEKLTKAIHLLSHETLSHESRICSQAYYDLMTGLDEKTIEVLKKLSGQNFVQATIEIKCQERIQMMEGTFLHQEISYQKTEHNKVIDCGIDRENDSETGCLSAQGVQDLHANLLLDGQLNKNEPVIVYYNASALHDKIGGQIKKKYNHFSVIIGRQYNQETKTCEYLLRNSWGTDCSFYPDRLKKKCTQGNIWMSRQDLLKSAGGRQVFIPK